MTETHSRQKVNPAKDALADARARLDAARAARDAARTTDAARVAKAAYTDAVLDLAVALMHTPPQSGRNDPPWKRPTMKGGRCP